MGTIQDMLDSEVMAEPRWPRCARCEVELIERKDARTGKPVREGGRGLLECPRCRELVIGPQPRREMRRFRLVRLLVLASGLTGSLAVFLHRLVFEGGLGELGNMGLYVTVALIGGAAIAIQFGLDAAARAMTLRNTPDARVTWWAYVIFWIAVVGLHGWLVVRLGWPMMKAGTRMVIPEGDPGP